MSATHIDSITFNTGANTLTVTRGETTEVVTEGGCAEYLNSDPHERTYAERLQDVQAMGWAPPEGA